MYKFSFFRKKQKYFDDEKRWIYGNYSSYTVNLVWLHPSIREPQGVQCFKLVILELPNVRFRSVFVNPVTYNYLTSYHNY